MATGASGWQQGGNQPTSYQGGNPPTSNRGGKPASVGRGRRRATSGGLVDLPSEREGTGDGQSWYEWSIQETGREAGERRSPPYPIGTVPARREAIGQIYEHVAGKDLPPCNVTSEAIRAYYPRIEAQTLKMWACQVLYMISEYHMVCVTRGSPVTSPIVPEVIEDQLPPLAGYTLPEDSLGITDVRVRDHQAKTLQVAVWLHRLDMALSGEPAASGSLVWAQHTLGHLLTHFLAPATTWGLQFEDVVNQVLRENREQNERRRNESSSSLSKCSSRRTKLRDEFDVVSKTLEVTTDRRARKEMEQRLAAIPTSLNAVENSISKFENLIEDCRMVEEEARQDQFGSGEEAADVEMVDQEERGNPESSGSHMEADTEDNPLSASGGDTIPPEEEEILLGGTPQPEDHSPGNETASVSGGIAELHLASPTHPGPEERETPQ